MTRNGSRAIQETAAHLREAKSHLRRATEAGASNFTRVCLRTVREDIDGMLQTLREVAEEEAP